MIKNVLSAPFLLAIILVSLVLVPVSASAAGGPDLSVDVFGPADAVPLGNAIRYTVWANNLGDPATDVVVTVTPDSGLTVTNVSTTNVSTTTGTCTTSSVVSCTFASMDYGQSAKINIDVTASNAGAFSVNGTVSSSQTDANPANDSSSTTTTVVPSVDLTTTVTASPYSVEVGLPFTHTVTVSNAGPITATGASIVTSYLPSNGARLDSYDATFPCTLASGVLTCDPGDLGSGATRTITIRQTAMLAGTTLMQARATSAIADRTPADNQAAHSMVLNNPPYDTWLSLTSQPPLTWGSAFAYDRERKTGLVFGGEVSTTQFEPVATTWLWNGSEWAIAAPATSPSARSGASAAYRAADGTILLFGGYKQNGYSNETWAWDGQTWTQRSPVISPPARAGAVMAERNGTIVLFGGSGEAGPLSDTWAWDGTSWRSIAGSAPPARDSATLVSDEAAGELILFGGCCDANDNLFGDTWVWNGSRWTKRTPARSPSARAIATSAFDRGTNTATVSGGVDNTGATLSDTWSWRDGSWMQRSIFNAEAHDGAAMFYSENTQSGRMILAGGANASGVLRRGTFALRIAPAGRLIASNTPIAFGSVLVGATVRRLIAVRNEGTAATGIDTNTTHVVGANSAGFFTDPGTCGDVKPAASCSVGVNFRPSSTTPRSGAIVIDPAGPASVPVSSSAALATTVTIPALASNVSINASFPVSWSNPGQGVVYDVQYSERSVSGLGPKQGPWKTWKTGATAKSAWMGGSGQPASLQGHTYQFLVRARRGTEIGSWVPIPLKSAVVPIDDRSGAIIWSSGWTSVTSSGRYYGTLRQASTAGKTATIRYETNMFTIVGDKCPTCGAFDVYIDNVKVARVDSYRSTALARQTLYSRALTGGIKPHLLKIVTVGTSGRPTVKIDAIAAAR